MTKHEKKQFLPQPVAEIIRQNKMKKIFIWV